MLYLILRFQNNNNNNNNKEDKESNESISKNLKSLNTPPILFVSWNLKGE